MSYAAETVSGTVRYPTRRLFDSRHSHRQYPPLPLQIPTKVFSMIHLHIACSCRRPSRTWFEPLLKPLDRLGSAEVVEFYVALECSPADKRTLSSRTMAWFGVSLKPDDTSITLPSADFSLQKNRRFCLDLHYRRMSVTGDAPMRRYLTIHVSIWTSAHVV